MLLEHGLVWVSNDMQTEVNMSNAYVCGGAINVSRLEDDTGCSGKASLMVICSDDCYFFCAHCFVVDCSIIGRSLMILKLPGFGEKEDNYLHKNCGHITDGIWDVWPTLNEFVRSVQVWQEYAGSQKH